MITDLHHVSLAVTDLDRARAFYGGTLGLRELERPAFSFPGAWYAAGPRQLHLIVAAQPRTLRGTREIDSHDGHLALRVADLGALKARLTLHGVAFVDKPDNATPWHQVHCTDPDGNGIELNAARDGPRAVVGDGAE